MGVSKKMVFDFLKVFYFYFLLVRVDFYADYFCMSSLIFFNVSNPLVENYPQPRLQ